LPLPNKLEHFSVKLARANAGVVTGLPSEKCDPQRFRVLSGLTEPESNPADPASDTNRRGRERRGGRFLKLIEYHGCAGRDDGGGNAGDQKGAHDCDPFKAGAFIN
jgi:hypothetical protein